MNSQITNPPSKPVPVAVQGGGFVIPSHDEEVYAYYGSTNNIQTITYKNDSVSVGVVTFTYAGSGVSSDDKLTGRTFA